MSSILFADQADVYHWLDELESSVVNAELALCQREWRELAQQIVHQRRYTHGLKLALESRADLVGEVRAKIDERISGILIRRAQQLRRLERFHSEVGRRLRELTQFKLAWKEMAPEIESIALNVER